MPPDCAAGFSVAGLTTGKIGASAGLEISPERRAFSSPIVLVVLWSKLLGGRVQIFRDSTDRVAR